MLTLVFVRARSWGSRGRCWLLTRFGLSAAGHFCPQHTLTHSLETTFTQRDWTISNICVWIKPGKWSDLIIFGIFYVLFLVKKKLIFNILQACFSFPSLFKNNNKVNKNSTCVKAPFIKLECILKIVNKYKVMRNLSFLLTHLSLLLTNLLEPEPLVFLITKT